MYRQITFLEQYILSSIPSYLMFCLLGPKPMPKPTPEPEPEPMPKKGKTDHDSQIPTLS